MSTVEVHVSHWKPGTDPGGELMYTPGFLKWWSSLCDPLPSHKPIAFAAWQQAGLFGREPDPPPTTPRSRLEATLRKFESAEFIWVKNIDACARDLDRELHYTELVEGVQKLVTKKKELAEWDTRLCDDLEAVLSKIEGSV